MVNLWKFERNWTKIVDFSLIAWFLAVPKRGAQVCIFCKILCTHMKQSKVFYPFPIFFCSFQICFAKSIFECSKDLFANVLKWESGQGRNVLWLNPPMHKFYWHFILYMIWWLSYFTHHLINQLVLWSESTIYLYH